MISSDNMLGDGALSLGNLDFNAALEASVRPAPDRSFLDAAIEATDIMKDAPSKLEPMVNPMRRLTDVCLFNEDEEAAERVKDDVLVTDTARGDVFGQNMLIGVELADMMTGGDVYETAERFIGALPREQQQAWLDKLNHCHTKSDGQALVGELFRNGVVEQYRTNKAKQESLEEERGLAFNGVFSELVKDANNEEAWNRFREGQARGAFTDADKKALDSAAKAWGMMEILMSDYTRSGAAVLTDAESGERIFNELYGDEMAQAVFLNVLNNEVQDLKNDASRRNALVRFGQAFAASTNNLMAGVIGGKFKAFVTDEQVEAYNREWERARELSGRENPNVAVYAEGDNWVEKYLLPGNARIDAIRKAAQESGQMNKDGSLRKMTAEERKSTQELGAFRGVLNNAVQGMYDVPGVAAKLGKMMPDSMIYLVPGGMFASAGSMHTQELARRSGEGEDYVSANTKAAVEAGISAAVEKLAFGSLKPARMAPGLDWLMSRKVVGQALGKIYGSTAGRIGLGVAAGSAEETFAEPLAGLIMRGVYNVAAADELQLADPLGTYQKEMEEMLAPDQILVTGMYGLLLGGVSVGGHMQAAEDYREMYEHLVSIGVDEGRAAQAARDDAAVAGFKATKALFDEAAKKDTKGVIAYLAELYPQIEPLNVAENLFSTWQLPHLIPAENGQVKVQEKDEEGKVTETLMSKEAADLLVQARLEQMKSSEIAKFANQLLGVAMAGKASSETDRFIVEEVDGAMDADYFTRLANAAGVRLQQGARADEVAPEIHQHLTLGQLVQQGQAWEQRMEIQRNEVDRERVEKKLPPLTDEEWAERKKAYVAAVNRQSVRGADGRKRTLLRVSRGHYGAMNVLEDLTEDFIARDMAANNRGLEWYVQNIRELETALGRQNEFLRELGEGKKPVNQMDIIEAVGKIAQSKLLADTVKGEHGFSAALKSFLEMIRTLILKAAAMLKLGKAINQALTDETVRGKMDTEFLQLVDDVVARDIEFLRELQLEDGLKAMQRVIAARQEAKADTRVKRRRKAKTPVLDKAEKNHGKQVREAARKKRRKQAKVDADVAVAEAALEGDFSSSVVNQEELDAIKAAAEKDGTFMKAPNGEPTNLTEQQWLQVRTAAFKRWFGDWESSAELTIDSKNGNYASAKEYAKSLAGKELKNDDSGIVAYVNSEQRKELTHQSKARISQGNGFTVNGHYAVVMRIDRLFRRALRCGIYPDLKHGDPNVRIHRFACPIVIDGEPGIAWMTAKETFNQEKSGRLYNLELLEIDKLAGKVGDLEEHNLLLPPAASKKILARVNELRKTYFENVSKIVDEKGEPLVVYHGSLQWFQIFNDGNEKHQSGAPEGTIFANDNREIAVSFVDYYGGKAENVILNANDERHARMPWGVYRKGGIYPLFMNLKNPLVVDFEGMTWHGEEHDIKDSNWYAEEARKKGHDGLIIRNVIDVGFTDTNDVPPSTDYVAFASNQVKSATDNRGTFDGAEADMTMSVTAAQEQGLFTDGVLAAENAVVVEPGTSFSVTALHATPHRFRKFTTDKMGSGEGNQAFGWGLYFAESEEVNRDYHRRFSQQTSEFILDGKKVRELDLIEFLNNHVETDVADYALMAAREDGDIGTRIKKVQDEKKQYEEWLKNPLDSPYADWQLKRFISGNKAQLKALRFVKKHKIKRVGASNYRVELNVDDGSLLMWDTPVSDKLQREVENLQRQPDKADLDAVFAEMKAMGIRSDGPKPENMRGYQVYNELARILGGNVQDLTSPRFGQGPKLASEWLLARGIRGIKYFDGYSRVSKGENKTYNYVIFSGDDVKITGVNETGDYNAPWEEYEDVDASFSVVGESAANWDKIKHRAFKGRDDGKLRVELDASQAMFRSPSYRERVDEIKAFIEEQRELAVEDGRQRQYAELEARLDRLDEAMDSASEDEVSEILREYERIENERKDFRRKLYGEWRAVFPEIEMEDGDYLLLERAILGEKGASRTNNAVFMLASMRDNLGITPVERALHPKLEADRESIVAALKRLKESEVAQELKAVYDRTEAGERTEEMRARAEQLADDVRQEAVRLGVPERILRGKPWFRVHMELFERDAEDGADAALRTVLLEDVLDFPELYEAYPQLRDYRVYGDMLGSTAYRGMYDGWNSIVLNDMLGEQEVLGTLLHEVQHAIQKIEGFAKGANTRNGMDAYMRSAGEIEARNVQLRRDWTAAERAARPFNETLEYPGEALVSFSVSDTLMEDIAMARKRAKNADGTVSQDGEMSRNDEVELCTMPDFMRFLGEPDVPVVTRVFTLRKLLTDHKLTDALTYEVVQKMNDPVLAIQETPSKLLLLLDMESENKTGNATPVVAIIEHKQDKEGSRYLVSAYPLEDDKETKVTNQFNKLVYCKYNTTAKFPANAPQGRAYELLRAAISGGHTSNVACKEDVVKWQQDFSSSLVNLDEESVAREVVDAGQGFRANLAYSEAIMKEMRGAMQRLRKLGSKTRTDREDAVAAMGTMVQMVKAAVAYLPQGYRFSVHPYMNRIEALAELAATGDIDLTSDIASKDILELENAEGVDLKKPFEEMVKEYGNVKLAEALERIMHRVSEQLRKHAKDRAVEKITELVERLAPKKDPKTGKLKGGKMSADAYRDLATVAEAMGLNAEQLEAKLAALRADMAKPGISEELRAELEDEMTLYDQFGDLAGMTAEDAVAAYEALRARVYFHRFEWDDKQARIRGARRAVVRRVVDGVGSVSENEYNAKKRRVKPSKRLKNLGDILSGMPAALAGMRGYLPLRQMADELALRTNAAGEAIKAWEAERWLALEALSKETMGKSWRECMDFMHKVQPSGVSFDRPKFRTVNVKTEELRELLAMTKEERKAEMKRRRETGGLEAERALSERDVQELQKKLEAMEEEGRVLSRVETRYMVEVQHEENLQLSRGEALYAILMFEQPTYTERLIMQGYTFEVIEGLREYVGDGMLQFGYGLRELFAKQGDRIAAVYENAFGVPFPREENYFAARWVVNGMKENSAEQLLAGMAGTAGAGNGWMKQRVNHNLELDMTKDALQVFLQATSLTDTWMATQDIVADFKAWTRDADFERALTAVLGKESYDNLKDWIRILEMGGVQDCLNMGVSQDVINGLYGSGAVAILGLRIQTLLKQTPAIFNGLLGAHDISAAEWFATMSRMKNGDAPMTYSRMVNSTLMKMRQQGKAGTMAGQAMRSGDTASSAAEGLLMASMLPMEWVDARCTAIGLVPVWNVYYQRAVDQGASAQEAEQAAWEQTALVANLASQPIGWLNKSKIGQSRNPIIKSIFYMLSENTAKFSLCRALWRGGEKKAAIRAWLVYGAANAAISAMLDALQGDPEVFEYGKREFKYIKNGASWDKHWNATAGLLSALGSSCSICQESTIGPLANVSSLTMAAGMLANTTKFVQGLIKLAEELSD